MRHKLKSRRNPRGRPHLKQRRTTRDLNFGVRFAFTIIDVFAIVCAQAGGKLEALASGACAADLQKLHRVTMFFFQLVVEKHSPLRGSTNIRDMNYEVKLIDKRQNRHILELVK